jgi:hypothetical protein
MWIARKYEKTLKPFNAPAYSRIVKPQIIGYFPLFINKKAESFSGAF